MAEMLAVPAGPAALLHPVVLRQRERGLTDDVRDGLQPSTAQDIRVDRDIGMDRAVLAGIDHEHLTREGPEMIDRGLRAGVALFGAVTEADDPFRGMAQVIRALLLRLGSNGGERRIARGHHRAP